MGANSSRMYFSLFPHFPLPPLLQHSTNNSVPELRIYRFWEEPIGPHPIAMFEVNLFTPAQFGAFIPWLVINRGPLSVLVHPNTMGKESQPEDEYRDHTQRATWMGTPVLLDLSMFHKRKAAKKAEQEKEAEKK